MQTMVYEKTEIQQFAELLKKYQSKNDYRLPATGLEMTADGSVVAKEYVALDREPMHFSAHPTEWALKQIAEYIGMHWNYAKKMIDYPARDLLAQNVNYWLSRGGQDVRLVRVFQGELIGFLSDMYQTIDNYDVLTTAMQTAQQVAAESGFEVQMVRPYLSETRMNASLLTTGMIELDPENVYRMGVNIRNSEVGNGSFSVRPMLLRTSCMNSNIFAGNDDFLYKRVHRGKRLGIGVAQWSQDTMTLQDATIRSEIVDVVRAAFNKDAALDRVKYMKGLKDVPFAPTEARKAATARILGLGEGESDAIWGAVARNTRYEFLQAVTLVAHDRYYKAAGNPERGTELEELGGKLIMQPDIWEQIERQTKKEEDGKASPTS